MRILFNVGQPGQVHLFKNAIWALEERGHDCKIAAVDKKVSLDLLDTYGFEYDIVGSTNPSLFSKAIELLKIKYNLYRISKSFKPDVLVGGVENAYVAHVGKMIRKPSIFFDDTEHAKIEHILMDPSAIMICMPSCFQNDLGKKQVRYNGYHYEVLSTAKGDCEKATILFEDDVKKFRNICNLKIIGMHGSPLLEYENRVIWNIYDFR